MTIGLNPQALIKTLAGWINQQRNPYKPSVDASNTSSNTNSPHIHKVAVPSSQHTAWAEFQWSGPNVVELTCVHQLYALSALPESFQLDEEMHQFNRLMENTQLPVWLWANAHSDQLELRWQERLVHPFQLSCIERVFSHSAMMANALCTRYCEKLPRPANQALH